MERTRDYQLHELRKRLEYMESDHEKFCMDLSALITEYLKLWLIWKEDNPELRLLCQRLTTVCTFLEQVCETSLSRQEELKAFHMLLYPTQELEASTSEEVTEHRRLQEKYQGNRALTLPQVEVMLLSMLWLTNSQIEILMNTKERLDISDVLAGRDPQEVTLTQRRQHQYEERSLIEQTEEKVNRKLVTVSHQYMDLMMDFKKKEEDIVFLVTLAEERCSYGKSDKLFNEIMFNRNWIKYILSENQRMMRLTLLMDIFLESVWSERKEDVELYKKLRKAHWGRLRSKLVGEEEETSGQVPLEQRPTTDGQGPIKLGRPLKRTKSRDTAFGVKRRREQ